MTTCKSEWGECPFTGEPMMIMSEAEIADQIRESEKRDAEREAKGICKHDHFWLKCPFCTDA